MRSRPATIPAVEIWPEVVAVMAERGFDLAGQEPKKVTVEMQLRADWAVAVGCEDTCPFVPTTLEEWEIPDPAGRPLAEVREIRDLVERQVQTLLATHLDGTFAATGHITSSGSGSCCPQLTREFEGAHEPRRDSRDRRRHPVALRGRARPLVRRHAGASRGARAAAGANARADGLGRLRGSAAGSELDDGAFP